MLENESTDNNIILLIEDNADDIALTKLALEKNNINCKLVTARDGAEALDYLFATGKYSDRNNSIIPKLILLDLKLPKIDGLEVIRRTRATEKTKLLPIVVLTTSNEKQDIASSYMLGANSYIRKPVDFDEFSRLMEHIATYWLDYNITPKTVDIA